MLLNKILQGDYTLSTLYHQIKLPLDIEISIPSDDPVRLLSAFVEGMDLSDLYATYDRIRKNQASPRQMLKIMIYASMNRIYSSRDIESACRRDINFMFLLDGAPAPDHSTIARFISMHLSQCSRQIMSEVGTMLLDLGEVSGENIFIDGTKIESVANKYSFVWKKAVSKNEQKLRAKLREDICLLRGVRRTLWNKGRLRGTDNSAYIKKAQKGALQAKERRGNRVCIWDREKETCAPAFH